MFSGRQTELAIVTNDFMKIQTQYANPCTVEQKDVEAFRQRLLEVDKVSGTGKRSQGGLEN